MSDVEAVPAATDDRHTAPAPAVLIATLSVVALTVAVLQTAVVPILGVISAQLQAAPVDVSWAVTANLLAAAASTPLIGRIADLHTKKLVLLAVLVVVLAGSLLAATTASLPLLIAARVLQGASFALYPIGISILRQELPADRLMGAMAIISGVLGFGGGTGLVITGLLMRGDADYHRVFWFTTAFTVVVIGAVAAAVPNRPRTGSGSIDWPGALGLAGGLTAVLLAITQGSSWKWTSPQTVGCAAGGIALLVAWWCWERRCAQPLVSIGMLTRRPILLTNIATVLVGMGLYCVFLGLTDYVQAPVAAGYGMGASVLYTSVVFLLPGAVAGFLTALVSGRWINRFGARRVLVTGSVIGIVGFVVLAVLEKAGWPAAVAGILVNVYITLAYGALPALVVSEVEPSETAVATSINAIARTLGGSMAAALIALLLTRTSDTGYPPESSFTAIFALGAVTGLVAMVLIACSAIPLRATSSGGDNSSMRSALTALLAGTMLTGAIVAAPPAQAAGKWALNGTYTATSNGEWARTNDVFHNEVSVRAVWTISSQCSYPTECTGTVNSDQGWTAPIYQTGGEWYVKHIMPKWMPCPDGSAADGFQVFRFKAMTPSGDNTDPTSNTLVGEDSTTGPGGACGRSLPLFIAMPFKLVKIG